MICQSVLWQIFIIHLASGHYCPASDSYTLPMRPRQSWCAWIVMLSQRDPIRGRVQSMQVVLRTQYAWNQKLHARNQEKECTHYREAPSERNAPALRRKPRERAVGSLGPTRPRSASSPGAQARARSGRAASASGRQHQPARRSACCRGCGGRGRRQPRRRCARRSGCAR